MSSRKNPEDMSREELIEGYTRLRESSKALLNKAKEAELANDASAKKEQLLKQKALEVVRRCKSLEEALQAEKTARLSAESQLAKADEATKKQVFVEAFPPEPPASDIASTQQDELIASLKQDLESYRAQAHASAEVLSATQLQLDEYIASSAKSESALVALQQKYDILSTKLQQSLSDMTVTTTETSLKETKLLAKVRELKAELATQASELRAAADKLQQEQAQHSSALEEQQEDFEKLASRNLRLLSELSESRKSEELTHAQLHSLKEEIEQRDKKLVLVAESAEEHVKQAALYEKAVLQQRLLRGDGAIAPAQLDVIMAVEREEELWCLVHTRGLLSTTPITDELPPVEALDEDEGAYHWVLSGTVSAWNTIRKARAASKESMGSQAKEDSSSSTPTPKTFSIVGDDENPCEGHEKEAGIPPSLNQLHREAVSGLETKLNAVISEHSQSAKAFETYRDRTKASLVETLEKLRISENALRMSEEAAAASSRGMEVQIEALNADNAILVKKLDASNAAQSESVAKINDDLTQATTRIRELEAQIVLTQRQLQAAHDKEELAALELKQQQGASAGVNSARNDPESSENSHNESTNLHAQVAALEEALTAATQREKVLKADMKKKSEMARQVVTAQEKEVQKLRAKVQALSKTTASETSQAPSSSDGVTAGTPTSVRFATPLTTSSDSAAAATRLGTNVDAEKVDYSPTAVKEREILLRQAFYGLLCADAAPDMQHMNRVVCAVLRLSASQSARVAERVEMLANAVSNQNTINSLSGTVSDVSSTIGSGITSLTSLWT